MMQPAWCSPIHSHSPGYIGAGLPIQHQPQSPGGEKSKEQHCPPLISCLGPDMPPELSQAWGKAVSSRGAFGSSSPPPQPHTLSCSWGKAGLKRKMVLCLHTLPFPGTAVGMEGTPRGLT